MSTLRAVSVFATLMFSVPAIGSEEIRLTNWVAPSYWQSPAPAPAAEARPPAEPGARYSQQEVLALPSSPLPFVAVTPCRQFDSRNGSVLVQNTPQTVTLTGAPCAIPSNAEAVAANITVFNISGATGNGVFKVGTVAPPTTAWINYPETETQRANAGVLPLGAGGTIVVQINQGNGSVDFVVDVFGYYSPQPGIGTSVVSGQVSIFAPGCSTNLGSVTVTVPASGLVEVMAQVEMKQSGGNTAIVCLSETSIGSIQIMSTLALAFEKRWTLRGSTAGTASASQAEWFTFFLTAGSHTFNLLGGFSGGGGPDTFQNRTLLVRATQ